MPQNCMKRRGSIGGALIVIAVGIFFLVINAFILKLASGLVPGFIVATFGAAFIGAAVLALLHMLVEAIAD